MSAVTEISLPPLLSSSAPLFSFPSNDITADWIKHFNDCCSPWLSRVPRYRPREHAWNSSRFRPGPPRTVSPSRVEAMNAKSKNGVGKLFTDRFSPRGNADRRPGRRAFGTPCVRRGGRGGKGALRFSLPVRSLRMDA